MKRKLTNAQMQDSIAELTDDVTALKDDMQEVKVTQSLARQQFAVIFEALDHAATVTRQTAINQLRFEQQEEERRKRDEERQARDEERMVRYEERMTRLEATVQKISDTVDRYLSARLNGGSKN